MSESSVDVGIDVSKQWLDVCILPTMETFRVANDADGIADLLSRLTSSSPGRIVLEASGGYEHDLTLALAAAELPVIVANPKRIRDFARSAGMLEKSDRLDAQIIATYSMRMQPPLRPISSEMQRHFRELVRRREDLLKMRTMEKNRRGQAKAPHVKTSCDRVIEMLDQELSDLDGEARQAIESSPHWQALDTLLQSMPGVGPHTSEALLAELPELGTLSRGGAAKLAGLAALVDESGSKTNQRHIRHGRKRVRNALYMAALAGVRWNATLRVHYQRLIQTKPKKVALIAIARKMLVTLNQMAREQQPWYPTPEMKTLTSQYSR